MNTQLISNRMSKNWSQYKVMRAAAGLPWEPTPDVLVLNQNPKPFSMGKKFGMVVLGAAVVLLVLFSFRWEKKRKRG